MLYLRKIRLYLFGFRQVLLFCSLVVASFISEANDTIVLSGTTHAARTMECGDELIIFDKGGADNDGVYASGSLSNWYYIRTTNTGTPLRIQIEATLANDCSLTIFNEYPSSDNASSPSFATNYPGPHGIAQIIAGDTSATVVSATGKASIRFLKSGTASRICNYRIRIWTSDTSEVYDITNTNITVSGAQISWLDSSDATLWTVRYGTNINNLSNSIEVPINPLVSRQSAVLTGLAPSTPYYVRIYNNAQTTESLSGFCTRNDSYFITQGDDPVPLGCLGDFTDLSANNVICTYGYYDNLDENYGVVSGRHTVIDDADGCDPIIGEALRMVPEGYTQSVRLGDCNAGNQAESIVYRFRVDTSQNDMLLLQYAAVLQNPTDHSSAIQPRLSLQVLRADGTEINDNCYQTEFVASSLLTTGAQWQESEGTGGTRIFWHDWSTVGVDLLPLEGEELYIKVTTRDCNENASERGGAHYGYAYFTLECQRKTISYEGCGEEISSLMAPPGFIYDWHELGSEATLSTEQVLPLPDNASATYECTMSFYGSSSEACSFNMRVNPTDLIEVPHAQFSSDNAVAAGTTIDFVNSSYVSSDSEGNDVLPDVSIASYQWDFGDGTSSTETNPNHAFPVLPNDRVYTVTLTASLAIGCQSQFQSTILVYGTGTSTPYGELFSDGCLTMDSARLWEAPELDWSSSEVLSTYTIPLVGDLNGDGHPNIVCMGYSSNSSDTKTINVGQGHRINNTLAIFDGVTKAHLPLTEPQMKNHAGNVVWADEFSVAPYGILRTKYLNTDVDTGLIVVATRNGNDTYSGTSSYYLQAYDIHGVNVWTSSSPYGTDVSSTEREYPVAVSFADFNGDGYPEVYVRNKIFDAATGQLLLEVVSENGNEGNSWSHKCGSTNYYGILSVPFAADLTGDGNPELILGNEVYHIDITSRTDVSGNSAALIASHTPPNSVSSDGHTQVADFNGDGYLDVLVSVRNMYSTSASTYYYVWDVHNDTVSNAYWVRNNNGGKSIPLIADIDNDGALEIVVQQPCESGNRMRALRYNADLRSFTEVWGRPNPVAVDDSWSNTLTMFDFNGDGYNELLFSGRSAVYVLDGRNGNEIASMPFGEVTVMDYPVIADVDNDGSVEFITIDAAGANSQAVGNLHIFRSSGVPWSSGRSVWNQYMYNATCVNNDLTIPTYPVNNAIVLTDPDGVSRQPLNGFLCQVPLLDMFGRPSQYAADLTVTMPSELLQDEDSLYVPMQLCNQGEVAMQAPFSITVYSGNYRGDAVDTIEWTQVIVVGECVDTAISIPMSVLCNLPTTQLVLSVNDNGGGVAQHGNNGQQPECDTVNNLLSLQFSGCREERNDSIVACNSYTWLNGETYTQSIIGSEIPHPTFVIQGNNGNPDTLVTLYLTINHGTRFDTAATACQMYTWNRTGETYTEGGSYPYSYTNADGCTDTLVLQLTINNGSSWDTMAQFCGTFIWQRNGEIYSQPGDYDYVYEGANGCTDTVSLHLTYADGTHDTVHVTRCGEFEWHQIVYSEPGVYTYEYFDSAWCPSVDTLFFVVAEPLYRDTAVVACNQYLWWRNGEVYQEGGTYISETVDDRGCLQSDTLHLVLGNSVTTSATDTVCDVVEWHGSRYYNSDTLVYSTTDDVGCESVDMLFLTVIRSPTSTAMITACDRFDWYEYVDITESTDSLVHRFPHPSGCDSVVSLQLTINYSDTSTHIYDTSCGTYQWHDLNYTSSGIYRFRTMARNGCDSVVTLHLTLYPIFASNKYDTICEGETYYYNGTEYTATGNYSNHFATIHGCDSLVVLHLYALPYPNLIFGVERMCPTEEYKVSAITNGQLYTWSTLPGGNQLTGQEHNSEVLFSPRDTMRLYLTVDYGSGVSCPVTDYIELVPIHNVIAAMECQPEVLNRDFRTTTATDASVGHTHLAWYVDNLYWGDSPSVACTAPFDASQVELMLVAYNDFCADTVHRTIDVADESLFVPNVFTPSLSTNATFRAYGTGILEFRIGIYNREGIRVFEADDIETEWDGTHEGKACPQANYVYRIQYRGELVPDGWKSVTGSVLLLR